MLIQAVAFAGGLTLLYLGAEWLVRGAARLADSLGMSPVVVGLTVVAFGTSAPELVVSSLAAARGAADVALGNVVGSNIANIGLILGICAVLYPLRVEFRLVGREIPLGIAAAAVLVPFLLDGVLGRADAALLLLAFVTYMAFLLRGARAAAPAWEAEMAAGLPAPVPPPTRLRSAGLAAAGLLGLVAGAQLLVNASVYFAGRLGISDLVVGLTVVAVGTSLPELATSVVAALRRQADIAVANVVGSNLFNVLFILPASALVRPLPAGPTLLRFEIPVLVAASVLLLPLAWTRFRLVRPEGVLLLAGYAGFVGALVARSL